MYFFHTETGFNLSPLSVWKYMKKNISRQRTGERALFVRQRAIIETYIGNAVAIQMAA